MYKILILVVIMFVPYLTAYAMELRDFEEDEEIDNTEKQILEAQQIRCTRRFSPGVCMEEVKPVWTYNFQLQNCTERLGCRQPSLTNRFLSYRQCMFSCQSLVQIYNHILSQQSELNETQWVSPQRASLRKSLETTIPDTTTEDDTGTYEPPEPYVASSMGREDPDTFELEELMPPDLDRRPPDFFKYDPVHYPQLF